MESRLQQQHMGTDILSLYLDDAVSDDERSQIAGHLSVCPACRAELDQLRATVELLRGLPQYRPARSFQLGPDYAAPAASTNVVRLLPVVRTLSVAAVIAFLVMTGALILDRTSDIDGPSETAGSSQASLSQEDASSLGAMTDNSSSAGKLIDRGEAASNDDDLMSSLLPRGDEAATGDSASGEAALSGAAGDPSAPGASASERGAPSATEDEDASPWLITSIALGGLAIVLVGCWLILSRMSRQHYGTSYIEPRASYR